LSDNKVTVTQGQIDQLIRLADDSLSGDQHNAMDNLVIMLDIFHELGKSESVPDPEADIGSEEVLEDDIPF